MRDDQRTLRYDDLRARRDAQLVRLDRHMQALELFARKRVTTNLADLPDAVDTAVLDSIVQDVKDALRQYAACTDEIKRL